MCSVSLSAFAMSSNLIRDVRVEQHIDQICALHEGLLVQSSQIRRIGRVVSDDLPLCAFDGPQSVLSAFCQCTPKGRRLRMAVAAMAFREASLDGLNPSLEGRS